VQKKFVNEHSKRNQIQRKECAAMGMQRGNSHPDGHRAISRKKPKKHVRVQAYDGQMDKGNNTHDLWTENNQAHNKFISP
jgi:hypothetical protein